MAIFWQIAGWLSIICGIMFLTIDIFLWDKKILKSSLGMSNMSRFKEIFKDVFTVLIGIYFLFLSSV